VAVSALLLLHLCYHVYVRKAVLVQTGELRRLCGPHRSRSIGAVPKCIRVLLGPKDRQGTKAALALLLLHLSYRSCVREAVLLQTGVLRGLHVGGPHGLSGSDGARRRIKLWGPKNLWYDGNLGPWQAQPCQ